MYPRPPGALKSIIRLYVGLRTGYDLGMTWGTKHFEQNLVVILKIFEILAIFLEFWGLGIKNVNISQMPNKSIPK